ncbi:MAG: sugar ABC transporter substrate-binding protein [Thermotogae bacterium]|nr:sugar ABC transporter substrate-binding protein [Thermotogota bacterium]
MKKFVSIIMLVILLSTLFLGSTFAKKMTITWWINPWRIAPPGFPGDKAPTSEDFPKWISEEFMKLHPDVKVNYIVVSNKVFSQKLAASIATHTQPDVFKGPVWDVRWVKAGLLEPIDEYLTKEDLNDYYPKTLAEGFIDGKHYIWPWAFGTNGMGATMLLYYQDFDKAGIDWRKIEKNGWTMEEFLEVCKKLTWDSNGDGEIDHYALSLGAKHEYNILNFLYAWGAKLTNEDETEITLNSKEGADALQFLVDLVKKYKVMPRGVEGMGVYDVIGNFHSHRTSIGFGGPYEIGRITRYLKEGKGQIKEMFYPILVPFPHLDGKKPVAYATSSGFIIFKQKDPAKKEMVMKFVKFLTNKENTALLETLKYLTARKSVNENLFEDDPYMNAQVKKYATILHKYGMRFFGSKEFPYSQIKKYLIAAFEAAFAETKTPQQALDDFAREANNILKSHKK